MYQEERMLAILEFLKKHDRISVDQICSMYDVSRDTARRDLVKLEEQGVISRTRGGAVLPALKNRLQNYQDRLQVVSREKKEIGLLAAALVQDGENIIMDTSTTVQACAEYLQVKDCTVVTNSINQAEILSNKDGIDIHLLGGKINKEHRFLYGASTVEKLTEYHADKVFIGVGGIKDLGLAIAHEEDGMVKKTMIERADQVIVLADHTKFGKPFFYRFAGLAQVDVIVTDKRPDPEMMAILKENGVQLMITDGTYKE